MEQSEVVAAVVAPVVVTKNESSFSESTQEVKIEKIANGTIEVSSEKSVNVQSSVQQATDDNNVVQKRFD